MDKSFICRLKKSNVLKDISQKASIDASHVQDSNQIEPLGKYLYLSSDLLLQALPKEVINEFQQGEIPKEFSMSAKELLKGLPVFDQVTDHFNKKVKSLNRMKVSPKGFHLPEDCLQYLTPEILNLLHTERFTPLNIDPKLRTRITLDSLTIEDVIKPDKYGKELDWTNYLKANSIVYPYTLLSKHALSIHGFPLGFLTLQGQTIDKESIKHIFYIDPNGIRNIVNQGIYFEVFKPADNYGAGGKCGIISPASLALVIINSDLREVYFVNSWMSKKRRDLNTKLPPKLETANSFFVEG